ncbi:cobyric acid synthase [Blastomonas aquatica]|uniref:Cobyric acid synthase n=1 Tax=Blastomonas aquatica TaxID=1510276 RepID=A0ABQ1JP75_9SPHN|nr:cobyric acid synthase [Blastomonas aquatica]GGB71688.1 cobyric acid synthase [Blastomonas aquatica]
MAAVMLQGTGSDVGKSVLVAGLCRLLANRGLNVRPFKPQNMSNNAAVAVGGEIGRAQALQALACRVSPHVDMNPVLIKPQSDTGAQVVVHGKVVGMLGAADYQHRKGELLEAVMQSWHRLKADADIVIVEGAGSPAEINLRAGDIANMGFARAVNVPVVLVGDIDRGGVIASIVGTKAVIDADDAAMIHGFLINKFRGDVRLFDNGYTEIERRTGWPGLGVIPWLAAARQLPAEDAVVLDAAVGGEGTVTIAVPMLSRIANFDDFDPLAHEPGVRLVMVPPGEPLPGDAALVILPGTKATIADLKFLRAQGWDIDIAAHVRRGGGLLGICGGYQMLGQSIEDPDGVEGAPEIVAGLGYLPVATRLTGDKRVVDVTGTSLRDGQAFAGYEIHVGETRALGPVQPLLRLADGAEDGVVSANGQIAGCYIHRLFDHPAQRGAWLARLGVQSDGVAQDTRVDQALDALAASLEQYVNIDRLLAIAGHKP